MKKSFTMLMLGVLMTMSQFGYAQARITLQDVYAKIDVVAQTKPNLIPILQLQLQNLIKKQTDESKIQLLQSVFTYISSRITPETKKTFDMGSHIGEGPSGYKTLSVKDMQDLQKSIHLQGEKEGPIRVLEFIDFQCPFCQRQHNNKILEKLTNIEYPGKVRSAAVMFPLTGQRHELAAQAAQSAECAYMQGGTEAFYAYKNGLFVAGLQPTLDTISRVANINGLDALHIQTCLDQGRTSDLVQTQKNRGRRLGITGTPGSIVLDIRTGSYKVIKGAIPLSSFQKTIEQLYRSI